MIRFAVAPEVSTLPATFPDPFDRRAVHPVAQQAAREVMAFLDSPAARAWRLDAPDGGRMFGVLVVVAPSGEVGYLRAFSGTLAGSWLVDGWAPPALDLHQHQAIWGPGEAEMAIHNARCAAARDAWRAARGQLEHLRAAQDAQLAAMQQRHRERRARRRATRVGLQDPLLLHAVDQESRGDKAERRTLVQQLASERAPVESELEGATLHLQAVESARTSRSAHLLRALQATYHLPDTQGRVRSLAELFAPQEPPGGAGDCAGPRLLAHARALALRPVAMAEFWWGASPRTVDRTSGVFYPACRGKCGPILEHMLSGLARDLPRPYTRVTAPALDIVFEDEWLVVVDKPAGLLSVPGRGDAMQDSVLTRLRHRDPEATGPLLVHRLDLDTSGLLLAARDHATFVHLQALFRHHAVTKRYVAVLDGVVSGTHGVIDLPLRLDPLDRPRQVHDPVAGKPATTRWQVEARGPRTTRVRLEPVTGRTHQLRVHAAHPLGLDAPVVGDRLYGRVLPDDRQRLMLHAGCLELVHPVTGRPLALTRDPSW